MAKKKTIFTVLDEIANKDIPNLMEQIMTDTETTPEEKATRVGLLQTAQYHMKLLLVRYSP